MIFRTLSALLAVVAEPSAMAAPLHFRRGAGGARVDRRIQSTIEVDADGHERNRGRGPERRRHRRSRCARAFSRTMPPQSASGGCTPRPRKESAATNRKLKQKRRPNSEIIGGSALGRISRRMIHQVPSPRQPRRLDIVQHHDVHRRPSARGGRRGWSRGPRSRRPGRPASRSPT